MTKIVFNQISKKYSKEQAAVSDASFVAEAGEFVVLVGPSGCGKSTILRMVAGLENITSGDIFFDDFRINDLPPKDRDVGMVFQNYALYPHLTVAKNIAFPLSIRKERKTYINSRVQEVAEILELQDLLNRKPKELSGGQRQRVALGRALVRKPKVFLFDEPLSNLDAKLRVQMRTEIQRLQKKLGITSIYVTHDQVEAMTMGTKLVIMKDGIIQQIGTPEDIYNTPNNIFVAGFIGSPQINLFDIKDFPYIKKSKIASIGIRPENLYLNKDILKNPQPFEIEITNIENLGHEEIVYFYYNQELKCLRQNKSINSNINEKKTVYFEPEKLLYFDKEGIRII